MKCILKCRKQNNKNKSVKQPGLADDEVQRLVLNVVVTGWSVKGGPGPPEAHDCRVKQGEGDLASKEGQSPTVRLVKLLRKETG